MFLLTDETIGNAIDNISGFIVAYTAKKLNRPTEEISALFFESYTYALLSEKETGYYWDSIHELIDMFIVEIAPHTAPPQSDLRSFVHRTYRV